MLQFRAINFVPLFHTFTLPVLGDADLDRTDRFEGKTSMAFRYKGPCIYDVCIVLVHIDLLSHKPLSDKMNCTERCVK